MTISEREPYRSTTAEDTYNASIDAVLASMAIVRTFQIGGRDIERLADKDDKSTLTRVDELSEMAARQLLAERTPGIPVLGEESGLSSDSEAPFLYMHDPIDGTRPFIIGASTSTVINGVYDTARKQIVAATIGQPATGTLWHASDAQTWQLQSGLHGKSLGTEPAPVQVWDGDIHDNGTIFIDNFRGFARKDPDGRKRQILTDANVGRLFLDLAPQVAIENLGSNGMHHALVAAGGQTMAGSITTSKGGEWDLPGALTVLNAGGAAEGLHITDDRQLRSADPLDPFAYDMLLTANNDDSLRLLRQAVADSLK